MSGCSCEHFFITSTHHRSGGHDLSGPDAEVLARVMAALGTASRVRILAHLRSGSCTVGDLAAAVEMEQTAVSHQLRVLRDASLVVGTRRGRHTSYSLFDSHVVGLVDEMLGHLDHVRSGLTETPSPPTHQPHGGTPMSDTHTHDAAEPHTHEHSHGDLAHEHPHTGHDHSHVEHDHEHPDGGGDTHGHPHVHQAGLETEHAHQG